MANNHTPDELPDLSRIGAKPLDQLMIRVKTIIGPGTEKFVIAWLQPDGRIGFDSNASLSETHLVGSVIADASMKKMLGG